MRRVFPWGVVILLSMAHIFGMWDGCPAASPEGLSQRIRIVVDPGHGGRDPGVEAMGGGRPEKDWTLLLARELQREARGFPSVQVLLSRQGDETLSWRRRKEAERGADLWISLHLNADTRGRASGPRLFYPSETTEGAEGLQPPERNADVQAILRDLLRTRWRNDSILLAEHLNSALEGIGTQARLPHPVRSAPLKGLSELAIPAVLVELGFLTHPQDRARLQNPSRRRVILRALLQGIVEFLRDPRRSS